MTPIGEVLREALGERPLGRGLALGRLVRAWEEVVGERLARETAPWALEEGGLVVAASTAGWATQVRFLADEVRRRASDVLGSDEVRTVRVFVAGEGRKRLRRNEIGEGRGSLGLPGEGGPRW